LKQGIQNAASDGFDGSHVLIAITVGTGIGLPKEPTDNDYYCGVATLMQWLTWNNPSLHVATWEVFNEPDTPAALGGYTPTDQTVHGTLEDKYGKTGAAAAADLYAEALNARGATTQDLSDQLAVGAFNFYNMGTNCCGYIDTYLSRIQSLDGYYGVTPAAVSGHPYSDVTIGGAYGATSYHAGTSNLLVRLGRYGLSGTPVWLTEVGDWLDDPEQGATDGFANGQTAAAQDFENLGSVTGVDRVYWYGYQAAGGGFDSALVGPDGNGRPSYCVLFGATGCASHYQSNPLITTNNTSYPSVQTGYYGIHDNGDGTYRCRYDGSSPNNGANPLGIYDAYENGGQAPTNMDSFDINSTSETVAAACADTWGQ
jgi:hypothetical protein